VQPSKKMKKHQQRNGWLVLFISNMNYNIVASIRQLRDTTISDSKHSESGTKIAIFVCLCVAAMGVRSLLILFFHLQILTGSNSTNMTSSSSSN
jgi:hypothetical protein